MKRLTACALAVLVLLTVCASVQAVNKIGISALPEAGDNFLPDLTTHLRDEAPDRHLETLSQFVYTGGTMATDSDLTQTVAATVAYVHGYRVSQDATALTFTNTRRTYVYLDSESSRSPEVSASAGTGCTFLARSVRLVQIECSASSTTPTLSVPVLLPLFFADTSGGAITAVQDLRSVAAIPVLDLRNYVGEDFCLKLLAAVSDLPNSVGGTIDARGIVGPQYCSVDPFAGVKNVQLLLGSAQVTIATTWLITSGSSIWASPAGLMTTIADFGDLPMIRNATNDPANDGARDRHISIHGLRMDGNHSGNSTATEFSHCIQFLAVVESWVSQVNCQNTRGDGVYVGGGANSSERSSEDVFVLNNRLASNFRNGVSVTLGSRIHVRGNTVTASGLNCIDFEPDLSLSPNISNSVIINNVLIDCGGIYSGGAISAGEAGFGISIGTVNGTIQNVVVAYNQIDVVNGSVTAYGIYFRGVVDLIIDNNLVTSSDGIGIGLSSGSNTAPTRVRITNNHVRSSGAQGITYAHANPIYVANNEVVSSTSNNFQIDLSVAAKILGNWSTTSAASGFLFQGMSYALVIGNHAYDNSVHGLRFISTGGTHPVENTIIGNSAKSNGSNGIREDSSADDNLIFGNDVCDNDGAGIVVVGATTVVRQNKCFATEASGTGAVANGATSATITHGLARTPSAKDCSVEFTEQPTNATTYKYLNTFGATTFQLNVNDPGASGLDFAWRCDIR